ncbi:MAG TPA: hypothetical protein VK184_08740 [Nostocaceae cyanobacterium]|nr:hypothetical protein [Nostocaceae cyanobacterium]
MPYIEIKTSQKLGLTAARKIVEKGCVSAVLTTGRITEPAKKLFDDYDIAYAENIPEKEFMELEESKEG